MDDMKSTLGQRAADAIASFGGSWRFIGLFVCFIVVWMAINIGNWFFDIFDAYPFILLNLILSCLAAIQAPIIMMSQNRMASVDRMRDKYQLKLTENNNEKLKSLEYKIDLIIEKLDKEKLDA